MEPRTGSTLLDELVSPTAVNDGPRHSPNEVAAAVDDIVQESAIPQGADARAEVARRRNTSGE